MTSRPARSSHVLVWGVAIACAAALTGLASWLSPALGAWPPRLAYSVGFLAVSAQLVLSARLVGVPTLSVIAGGGIGSLALLYLLRAAPAQPGGAALLTAGLLAGVTLLGAAIGGRIERPGHLLAVFAISSLADMWSVFDPTGPSARLAEHAAREPDKLVLLALPFPMLGTDRIAAIIGAGDILFAALYLSALGRHGLNATRAAWAMLVGLGLGLAALLVFERALPLLPLIGAAVMVAEPAARSLPREDRRNVLIVVAALSLLIASRFFR